MKLALKLTGKTGIPPHTDPLGLVNATVAGAVRHGADPVGYTPYVGSPAQERDFEQYRQVRADAQRSGMRLIVWQYGAVPAYPHGFSSQQAFGRKIWPREHGESLRVVAQLKDILATYSSG